MKCQGLMITVLVLTAACAGPHPRRSGPPGVQVGQRLHVWMPLEGMSPSGKVLAVEGWMVEIESTASGQAQPVWIDMKKALAWSLL